MLHGVGVRKNRTSILECARSEVERSEVRQGGVARSPGAGGGLPDGLFYDIQPCSISDLPSLRRCVVRSAGGGGGGGGDGVPTEVPRPAARPPVLVRSVSDIAEKGYRGRDDMGNRRSEVGIDRSGAGGWREAIGNR